MTKGLVLLLFFILSCKMKTTSEIKQVIPDSPRAGSERYFLFAEEQTCYNAIVDNLGKQGVFPPEPYNLGNIQSIRQALVKTYEYHTSGPQHRGREFASSDAITERKIEECSRDVDRLPESCSEFPVYVPRANVIADHLLSVEQFKDFEDMPNIGFWPFSPQDLDKVTDLLVPECVDNGKSGFVRDYDTRARQQRVEHVTMIKVDEYHAREWVAVGDTSVNHYHGVNPILASEQDEQPIAVLINEFDTYYHLGSKNYSISYFATEDGNPHRTLCDSEIKTAIADWQDKGLKLIYFLQHGSGEKKDHYTYMAVVESGFDRIGFNQAFRTAARCSSRDPVWQAERVSSDNFILDDN